MGIFQTPATVEGISTLKDGGLSVRLHTQELNDSETSELLKLNGKFGWFLIKETNIQEDDIGGLEDIRKDLGGKSPSQRLRSVLYVMYKEKGDTSLSFEQYYGQKMEQFINYIKGELPK
jgi:hypothetical protein